MITKEIIKKIMIGEGLSVTDMASVFGVSRGMMHNYLNGNNKIKLEVLSSGLEKLGYNIEILKK